MISTLRHPKTLCGSLLCAALLAACSGVPDSHIVQGPLSVPPVPRPTNIERVNNGSIFQAGMTSVSLFTDERKARFVGDTVKVNISETLSATSTINTNTSRDTSITSKGPGAKSGLGLISSIMNIDASASGNNTLKGGGTTVNSGTFTGQVSASVINVLPNGHLVLAGERTISLNGDVNLLRFSGIVDPKDIQPGNLVASSDAVNARFEVVGRGQISDASSRSWIQRVLADSLAFW
jgi:flagellar L-ring protein precursor FlgH